MTKKNTRLISFLKSPKVWNISGTRAYLERRGRGRGRQMSFVLCTKARLFLVLLMEGDYRAF